MARIKVFDKISNTWIYADKTFDKNNAILYTEQSLSEPQKTQARTNIGAASTTDIPSTYVKTINNKSGNVSLTASDIGAVSLSTRMTLVGVDANGVEHVFSIYGEEDPNAPV